MTEKVTYFENFNIEDVITPVDVKKLDQLLSETNYDVKKKQKLIDGFTYGFELGYTGDRKIRRNAPNLSLRVGNETILWNKVMKEVKAKRYAGPFKKPPFEYYIQFPIGLVPKDGGKDTRLIFHLSYSKTGSSINSETPRHLTTVKYPDFNRAVRLCSMLQKLSATGVIFIGKSDMRSAFHNLGMKETEFMLLLMKAKSPIDGKIYFFIDKCLPFGASISCAHFQDFSDAVAHIMWAKTKEDLVNYLDDYLFTAILREWCNGQI